MKAGFEAQAIRLAGTASTSSIAGANAAAEVDAAYLLTFVAKLTGEKLKYPSRPAHLLCPSPLVHRIRPFALRTPRWFAGWARWVPAEVPFAVS